MAGQPLFTWPAVSVIMGPYSPSFIATLALCQRKQNWLAHHPVAGALWIDALQPLLDVLVSDLPPTRPGRCRPDPVILAATDADASSAYGIVALGIAPPDAAPTVVD